MSDKRKYKIVVKDNYDRELRDEFFLRPMPLLTKEEAVQIANILNNSSGNDPEDWYQVVDDNYKLFKFEP